MSRPGAADLRGHPKVGGVVGGVEAEAVREGRHVGRRQAACVHVLLACAPPPCPVPSKPIKAFIGS